MVIPAMHIIVLPSVLGGVPGKVGIIQVETWDTSAETFLSTSFSTKRNRIEEI
jgi:hypothetical protein